MRQVQQPFPVDTDVTMPEDEIDALFAQLEPITPPPTLIARILAQVPQEAATVTTAITATIGIPAQLLRQPEMDTWVALTHQRKMC